MSTTLFARGEQIRNEIQVLKKISEGHKNIVTMWGEPVRSFCSVHSPCLVTPRD